MSRLLIAILQGYRLLLSPWLGSACRFSPTCSLYAIEALRRHGTLRGGALAGWRLVRCGPWCAGGHDPVPPAASGRGPAAGLFTSVLSKARKSSS